MVEASFSLAERQASNHRRHRQWLVYTALPLASSTSAPELRAHLRWKSFGRDSVCGAGNWRGMADGCGCKGMVVIADRCAAWVRDG